MKVFISYKWEDDTHNAWVERFARDLCARGLDALLDKWEVRYGESFLDYMTRGVNNCDAILFVMTPDFLAAAEAPPGGGGAVKFEVQLAVARRLAGEHCRVVGILRRGTRSVQQLRDMRYADFRDDSSYRDTLDLLIADLAGATHRPLVVYDNERKMHVTEWGHVGTELETACLRAEFLPGVCDLAVWRESESDHSSPIAIYKTNSLSHTYQPLNSVQFATRVRAALEGHILIIQERHGILVLESVTGRVVRFLPIESVEDPIIRSEVHHPVFPLVALGTDYGRIIVWNWRDDQIMFVKHVFPAGEVNWISGLSFVGSSADTLVLCVENVLVSICVNTGEVISRKSLGPTEETTAIACTGPNGLLAVGGVMDTKVYRNGSEPQFLYQVRNSAPLVHDLRFSRNGRFLGIVDGGLGGSGVAIVEASTGSSVHRFGELWPPSGSGKLANFSIGERSISFSDDGRLVAVGQGGRVGLYEISVSATGAVPAA